MKARKVKQFREMEKINKIQLAQSEKGTPPSNKSKIINYAFLH
jgi:hypothetical protein